MASIRSTQVGQYLTVKKTAQIYGNNSAIKFLTNYSNRSGAIYPKVEDPNLILQIGLRVQVIGKGKGNTKYRESYVTVIDNRNNEFDIFASDLKRFFE